MVLVARVMGNVASLTLSEDEANKEIEEPSTSFRRILNESFGKISEVPISLKSSPQEHGSSTAATSREMMRILHLSLEEAFYLKYCEKCLDLVLMGSTGASVVLSTETPSGTRDGEVRHRGRIPQEIDFPAERIVDGGNRGLSLETDCERRPAKDAASPLSDEQAWQYCCQRLLAFPMTFAVYRHFRFRGYIVHSGQRYGAHFVLYEGSPDEVHSRYCVHVMSANGGDSWGHMKTMSRLMPDIAKSLLVCGVSYRGMDRDRSLSRHLLPLDTCSLQALDVAKVEVLSLSRLNDSEHTLSFGLDTPGHGHAGGLASGLGARGGGAGKARGSENLKKKQRGTRKQGGVK